MTPQALIDLAADLNPEKLRNDPPGALQDALTYAEALRQVVSQHSAETIAEVPKHSPSWTLRDRLTDYYKNGGMKVKDFAKELGVGPSTIHFWISGKHKPYGSRLGRVEKLLTQAGY